MNYGDILWVEDFDDGDSSPVEKKIENYYTKQRAFRVDVQSLMLPLLKTLADEKNFSKYSCAVLDINLTEGFESIQDEFDEIKDLLAKNQIQILDEHDPDQDADDYAVFAENAGYYVYLYLIRRGMPAERICMLTANKGNTTDEWEKNFSEKDLFKNAGLVPPEAFDRTTEREKFHAWLDKTLTPPYRLRACIVGMSRCAEEFLSDDETKVVLQNLPRIPLRLSTDEKVADRVFVSALREIVQPWESPPKDTEPLYRTTLKLTRNWLAHNILTEEPSLLSTAFLFGIGLRGLFGKKIKLSAEYLTWEEELLALLTDMDKKISPSVEKISDELIMKSAKEFFKRVTIPVPASKYCKLKIPLSTDIDRVIDEIGQKKNGVEPRLDTDLIRNFLHSVYPIYLPYGEGKIPCNHPYRLRMMFELDKEKFFRRKDTIEARYLNAVKNTLARAVDS